MLHKIITVEISDINVLKVPYNGVNVTKIHTTHVFYKLDIDPIYFSLAEMNL